MENITTITDTDLTESTYLIKVEMVDGTSQLMQITKEQAVALGIEFPETTVDVLSEDIRNDELLKRQLDVTSTTEPSNPNKKVKIRYNYKVINPQDLDLTSPISGRPKKIIKDDIRKKPTTKFIKTQRTRYGRVTRPPEHMKKVFENIVIEDEKHSHRELTTTEFKPLTTTNTSQKIPPLLTLSDIDKKKKRAIPAQYRCSTCKKAYLGRNKMSQHLRKHPDHGIISQIIMEDAETWCCLIETASKTRDGQKGIKFCQEILSLVKNARTLVKYFFKPSKRPGSDPTGTEYFVDSHLSNILNVKEGYYRFNENELCKDISIFSFLEIFDETYCNHVIEDRDIKNETTDGNPVTSSPIKTYDHNIISLGDELDCNKKIQSDDFLHKNESNKGDVNLHFGNIMDVIESSGNNEEGKINFGKHIENTKNVFSNIINSLDEHNNEIINVLNGKKLHKNEELMISSNKVDGKCINFNSIHDYDHTNDYIDDLNKNNKPHTDKQGKEIDIFRPTINNILNLGASDEHMIELLSLTESNKQIEPKPLNGDNLINVPNNVLMNQTIHDMKMNGGKFAEHLSSRKQTDYEIRLKNGKDEFDLNKLLTVDISDELILPDTGQVTSILDTSTSSDDIMNVDQFVNERFKKLTEVDMELQNSGIHLDLPIDCFNFHSN